MNQISFEFRIGYNWTEEASTSVEPNELESLLEDWFKVISAFDIDYEKINQNTSQNNNRDIYKRIKALLIYLPSDQQSLLLKLIEKIEEN